MTKWKTVQFFLTHIVPEMSPAVGLGHAVTVAFVVVASDLKFFSCATFSIILRRYWCSFDRDALAFLQFWSHSLACGLLTTVCHIYIVCFISASRCRHRGWESLVLCAGNEDDDIDDDVDNAVFQIPDAVFGAASCQTASVAVNGECITGDSQLLWSHETDEAANK